MKAIGAISTVAVLSTTIIGLAGCAGAGQSATKRASTTSKSCAPITQPWMNDSGSDNSAVRSDNDLDKLTNLSKKRSISYGTKVTDTHCLTTKVQPIGEFAPPSGPDFDGLYVGGQPNPKEYVYYKWEVTIENNSLTTFVLPLNLINIPMFSTGCISSIENYYQAQVIHGCEFLAEETTTKSFAADYPDEIKQGQIYTFHVGFSWPRDVTAINPETGTAWDTVTDPEFAIQIVPNGDVMVFSKPKASG